MKDERQKKIAQMIEEALPAANDNELAAIERLLSAITHEHLAKAATYINSLMDYRGEQVDENSYKAEITIHPFIMNSLNIVHGGIIATLADTAMGTLVHAAAPEGKTGVTSEIKLNYIRPAIGKKLFCEAKIEHRGSSIFFVTANILSDQGKLVAFASGSFFIIPISKHLKA